MLFIAPAVPSPTRSGLRMRGWLFLNGLAREHRVTLVAGSPPFSDESPVDVAALGDLVEQTVLLPFAAMRDPALLMRRLAARLGLGESRLRDWAEPTPAMLARIAPLRREPFDLIHVFRLYMLPVALAAQDGRDWIPVQLDLDDWESRARLAQAELPGTLNMTKAPRLRMEAASFEVRERRWLPRMSQCFVCSSEDAAALSACYGLSRVKVLENAVPVPLVPEPASPPAVDELLFVGSLGYGPNEDAVSFLLDEVIPLLADSLGGRFKVVVAGAGANRTLKNRLRGAPDVTWVDGPERVEPLYQRARIALVPVRAGGGTRVKALEAFANRRPVIATAVGMSGLDVEPGVHYLRAESPSEWAESARALLDSPALRERLVEAASVWMGEHSFGKAVERIAALSRGPSGPAASLHHQRESPR